MNKRTISGMLLALATTLSLSAPAFAQYFYRNPVYSPYPVAPYGINPYMPNSYYVNPGFNNYGWRGYAPGWGWGHRYHHDWGGWGPHHGHHYW